jgi:hypothetical protein
LDFKKGKMLKTENEDEEPGKEDESEDGGKEDEESHLPGPLRMAIGMAPKTPKAGKDKEDKKKLEQKAEREKSLEQKQIQIIDSVSQVDENCPQAKANAKMSQLHSMMVKLKQKVEVKYAQVCKEKHPMSDKTKSSVEKVKADLVSKIGTLDKGVCDQVKVSKAKVLLHQAAKTTKTALSVLKELTFICGK